MRKGSETRWRIDLLFRDERGMTSASMALSILISLSLVFTGAQVYRVGSASAEVQDVADASALSAENQVAEFMVVARFCDAVILSLSLTGITATGLGVAALCTPFTAELSEGLLKAGRELLRTRDKFADRSAKTLDKLQKALPYLSAACAAGVASQNDGDSAGSRYAGIALLVPTKGDPITVSPSDEANKLLDEIDSEADEIRQKAKEAEEAAEEANKAKERAFNHDCGNNPDYCMYERAAKLAGLEGGRNPLYTSVDAWSFSVALNRAKAYYRVRLDAEAPAGSSFDEEVKSHLRTHFFRYAVEEVGKGYVHETSESFDAYFPLLPRNTDEMRDTELYTKPVYPITEDESGKRVMHAWAACPESAGSTSVGSIAEMEREDFETCPTCRFTAASMGKVASASSSIQNGFEYHYRIVAEEAATYQDARKRADAPKSEVQNKAGGLLDRLGALAKETFGKRIDPSPPGRFGCVSFVVNTGSVPASRGFSNSFVSGGASLGPRAAISAATLVGEASDEGKTVLNSMLDGCKQNGGFAVGAAGMVLDAWSFLLKAYGDGQEALTRAVKAGLNSLPLVGASGLGDWASEKLTGVFEGLGLQPVEMKSLKAVLVNSQHVAAKDEGSFGKRFVSVKQRAVAAAAGSTDLFTMVLSDAERQALAGVEGLGDSVTIASIELLGDGGPAIPVTIPLPDVVKSFGSSAISALFDELRAVHGESSGVRVWE